MVMAGMRQLLFAAALGFAGLPAGGAAAAPVTEWEHARIHGHRIYYAMRGTGPTIVFLHGGGDSGEHSFARQLDVFSEHHHIVAPDQVGQGRTPDVSGPLTYTAMMEDTAELLQRLKLKHADIVGFSDGGILALMLAIRHPDLVRRLVISGVNIAPDGLNPEDLEQLRVTQTPKPKTIDEKLAQLWLTSPTLKIFHALPDAELCILPGTDHATFTGRSEWLNPIITSFLDRGSDSTAPAVADAP